MTFNDWWNTLTHREQLLIGFTNAKFVWQETCEVCAKIADRAEPYQAADLIRSMSRNTDV